MKENKILFLNNKGQRISGRVSGIGRAADSGLIYCHGLFSSKDGYKISKLKKALIETGSNLLSFDFSFSGESEGNIFDMSIRQEVEDLRSAFNFFCKEYNLNRVHIIGSSMGGVVALLFASERIDKVKSLVTIATPVNLLKLKNRISESNKSDFVEKEGAVMVDGVRINSFFLWELGNIDVEEAVKKINVPVLSFQGGKDLVVDPLNLDLINKNLNSYNRPIMIEKGDHSLTGEDNLIVLENEIVFWLREFN